MQIAVIGAGQVGRALGFAWAAHGYPIRFGVTNPGKHAALASDPRFAVTSVEDAVEPAELVVLATPYAAALQVAAAVPDWRQRILVDATNPIAPGLSGLLVGTATSGAQCIAAKALNARVVKAFNTTGFENIDRANTPAGGLFLPVAGDDLEAKHRVMALASLIGFDAVDLGRLEAAKYTEPLGMVWIEMAIRLGHGRDFGFVRVRT